MYKHFTYLHVFTQNLKYAMRPVLLSDTVHTDSFNASSSS